MQQIPRWIVYMSTMRHRRVTIIVPLPLSMAALCYRNPLTWSSGISQGAAQAGLRRYLLEPPSQRSWFNLRVHRALRNASPSACAAAAAPASASECAAAVTPPNALLAGRNEKRRPNRSADSTLHNPANGPGGATSSASIAQGSGTIPKHRFDEAFRSEYIRMQNHHMTTRYLETALSDEMRGTTPIGRQTRDSRGLPSCGADGRHTMP